MGGILRCRTPSEMQEVVSVRLGNEAEEKLAEAKSRFDDSITDGEDDTELQIPQPKTGDLPGDTQPPSITPPTPGDSNPSGIEIPRDPILTPGTTFMPTVGPSSKPAKKRKIVVTGSGAKRSGGHGLLASEDVTFKVVEAFEKNQGRYVIPVSHLRGTDGFGCDLISVASEDIRNQTITRLAVNETDVLRYIEVKGRSSRTGEVELTGNEYRAAECKSERYFIYRVYVDPNRTGHYEVAVLCDPLNSKAVRTVTRFDLAEGSDAVWFTCCEVSDDQVITQTESEHDQR